MQIRTETLQFIAHQNTDTLDAQAQTLLAQALAVAQDAYAPYSKFHVGCAILLTDGTVVLGSNQENVAYPSGLCAERVAIFSAFANKPQATIQAIAIRAFSENFAVDYPITPCGACRQVLAEYQNRQSKEIALYMQGQTGEIYEMQDLCMLLPLVFNESRLITTT
jgi:cytidine deaminase